MNTISTDEESCDIPPPRDLSRTLLKVLVVHFSDELLNCLEVLLPPSEAAAPFKLQVHKENKQSQLQKQRHN